MWWRDLFGKVARGDAACFLCGPGRVWRWLRAMSFCHVLERVQPLEKDGTRARDHNAPETTKHTVAPAPLSARAAIVKRDAQALERVHTSPQIEKKTKNESVTQGQHQSGLNILHLSPRILMVRVLSTVNS